MNPWRYSVAAIAVVVIVVCAMQIVTAMVARGGT